MNAVCTSPLLLVAACLEIGGDAVVRIGHKSHAGAAVVAFFLVAQRANLVFFGIDPDAAILVGGAFIIAGSLRAKSIARPDT